MSRVITATSSSGCIIRGRRAPAARSRGSRTISPPWRQKFYVDLRGRYRIFNEPEYRFYRSNTATPPAEGDVPYATSSALPATPTDTFADGTWLISVSYFNGVIDSGFLPIGPNGETYLRLDIDTGVATGAPPNAPIAVHLELAPGGVVRVVATYTEAGNYRADEWSIEYTTNGAAPDESPAVPDETVSMQGSVLEVLMLELPAQAHGTTVKVRVQTRRNDGTDEAPVWVYSEGSTVLTAVADAVGPDPIEGLDSYPGALPEGF